MDMPWGSPESRKFVTNVGLITSNGPHGHNVMAAEWTHHVSYEPGLIMINIGHDKATASNIKKSKEFGINIAAIDQNVISSVSGGSSGNDVDKIKVLKEMGVEFYKAKKINALMLEGAVLNVECKLMKTIELGDHTAFVGEALDIKSSENQPLIYTGGKYFHLGDQVEKTSQDFRDKISKIVEKHKKR